MYECSVTTYIYVYIYAYLVVYYELVAEWLKQVLSDYDIQVRIPPWSIGEEENSSYCSVIPA